MTYGALAKNVRQDDSKRREREMQKEDLWKILTDKNPVLLTGPITFTAKGIRKFFETVWDQGHKQGVKNGRVLGAEAERKNGLLGKDGPLGGIFG